MSGEKTYVKRGWGRCLMSFCPIFGEEIDIQGFAFDYLRGMKRKRFCS